MGLRKWEESPERVIRLKEVLLRTGLSRSTIYTRIAEGKFPRQVSLGERSVGWLKREVEGWLAEQIGSRPSSEAEWASKTPDPGDRFLESPPRVHRATAPKSSESTNCVVSVNDGSPDLKHLHLLAVKLHFDEGAGTFWLQLVPEK